MEQVRTGLDRIQEGDQKNLKGQRLGLLANQASLDRHLNRAQDIFSHVFPGQLKALFGPQHGYGGEDQDNMVETDHGVDPELGIPVFSLYAEKREPLPHMLALIDTLIIDLQDVGTRVYTFASTMLNCMKAAEKAGKRVMVLDRPNPLGGEVVEGPILKADLYSFVGPYRFPMRHALTMGEMALAFKDAFNLDVDLTVVSLSGWRRRRLWHETGLRWIMPSPNMPLFETALVYPGQVILEGTNLSEGRGTSRPFEIFGAPYINPKEIKKRVKREHLAGCHLQAFLFRPTFNKWRGVMCKGFFLHVLDPHRFRPYTSSLAVLREVIEGHGADFAWRKGPYEYEYERRPIDLILGDPSVRRDLAAHVTSYEIIEKSEADLEIYRGWRGAYLLYD